MISIISIIAFVTLGQKSLFKLLKNVLTQISILITNAFFYSCLVEACFLNISFAINVLLEFLNYWVYTPYEALAPKFSTDKMLSPFLDREFKVVGLKLY